MNKLLGEIGKKDLKQGLKATETKDSSKIDKKEIKKKIDATNKIRDVTGIKNDKERREYFFGSGVDAWYETCKDITFPTTFINLSRNQGKAILDTFNGKQNAVENLKGLEAELDAVIKKNHDSSAFIKLSTRSPKDSTSAFAAAVTEYKKLVKSHLTPNEKWILFSEQIRLSYKISNGSQALELLTTSERVVEDIEFALKGSEEKEYLDLKLVVRTFHEDVKPETEFRGFIWNDKLTCISQAFYKCFFKDLQGSEKVIEKDLISFFERSIKGKIKSSCYVIDLVWFKDDKNPLLIEVNPFDGEGLGTFPCSTGLFDWETDREVMTGIKPFELRTRDSLPTEEEMAKVDATWAKVVLEE